jgi:hypothetical protein
MAAKRNAMRKIRDILRLRLAAGLSIRQINASTKVSIGAIQKLLIKAEILELTWPLPDDLDDNRLAQLFYPGADTSVSSRYQVPDWPAIHQELKRKEMTKLLLWDAYMDVGGRATQEQLPKSIPSSIPTDAIATHSSATAINTGVIFRNAPCANSTRPVRSASLTTVDLLCPSSVPLPGKSVRPKCSSVYWALPTTPMLKRH